MKKPVKIKNEMDPVEVFAGTTWQAGVVKSLLENSDIETFMQDVIMGNLNPWWTAAGGAGSVRVFVAGKDFNRAKIVVDKIVF